MFKAIEKHADMATKQAADFQWKNPASEKIHEDAESKLMALLIKEYLEHYEMQNTLNVYLPEVDMKDQNEKSSLSREQLAEQAGIRTDSSSG